MRCRLEQLEQVTGEPDQDAIGNGTLHISEGKGGAGKHFWRREAWLAAVWLGGHWVLGRRRLKAFRMGRVAERRAGLVGQMGLGVGWADGQ